MEIHCKHNGQLESVELTPFDKNDIMWKLITDTQTFYEIELLEYISSCLSELPPGDIIDIGANIGNHSVYFGKFLAKSLIAIEANPDIIPTLRTNLESNVKDYTLIDCGVGESSGMGEIHIPDDEQNNMGAAQLKISEDNQGIIIRTLDSIISEQNIDNTLDIRLIKLDIEGMELPALKGGIETIQKFQPHLFIEIKTGAEKQVIDNFLEPLGYRSICHFCATPVYHYTCNPTLIYVLKKKVSAFMRKMNRKIRKII
ncbi:MAG: FkbM family methyltransferase [Lentisphaeria bacterium]|nr:FkbM family methyltransferase [Lentisphaeria bacterium]